MEKILGVGMFILLHCFYNYTLAQTDSTKKENDKIIVTFEDSLIKKMEKKFIPKKAALYSVVLPGLGQAYNRRYWKIPLFYTIGGVLGFIAYSNNEQYLLFKDSYNAKISKTNNPTLSVFDPFPQFSQDIVLVNRDRFRRDREFMVILTTVVYLLQIVDATVDAHLRNFDLSDDLSLEWEPFSAPIDMYTQQQQIGLRLKIWIH